MEEQVALYDESGRPCGVAPRSRVRAENLRHGATGIVVRDPLGRFYVHRRTDTKDVYPGLYDLCAGGVLQAGEEPLPSALRELAEELGVTGVPLESLGEGDYSDATRATTRSSTRRRTTARSPGSPKKWPGATG
jgi:8-oxo-dGTP pyrophosphatase MutT (NUDIX family)